MRPISRRYRNAALSIVFALLSVCAAGAGCRTHDSNRSINLVADLPNAERRAGGVLEEAVRAERVFAPDLREVLVLRAPARVTWTLRMPQTATFRADAALVPGGAGAVLRVGLSNNRWYQEFPRVKLQGSEAASWRPVVVDLSAYSGWAWSLFYRPGSVDWKLIINADAAPEGTIMLAQPRVELGK